MHSRKIVFYIFSLLLVFLVAFGIGTKSNIIKTASQNVSKAKQELIEEQQTSHSPDATSINFESEFYLANLYVDGFANNEGITVKASDVTQYSHYSLYKDWAYSFDVPTSYTISWDKTWDEIYSITYDVIIPHDFVNLKTYISSLDHEKVTTVLAQILLVEEINNDPNTKLTYEELSNYTIALTSSQTIDISNYKDGLCQTSLSDLKLNIVNVKTKKVVNSISLANLFVVPFVAEVSKNKGIDLEQISNLKINHSYSLKANELEFFVNFDDSIYGEQKADYGFVYKVNVLGTKQYASSRFSKQVQLTNIAQTLLDTTSNLKINRRSSVEQIESSFNSLTNNRVDLQILDKDKIPLSNSESIYLRYSQSGQLNDGNIDIWIKLTNGKKMIQLPISLNQPAFDPRKDVRVEPELLTSKSYSYYLEYMWGTFYADPSVLPSLEGSQPIFSGNPTGDWANVPDDTFYTVPLSKQNDGRAIINQGAPYSDNSYLLTSMVRTTALESIGEIQGVKICGADLDCTSQEAALWTPSVIDNVDGTGEVIDDQTGNLLPTTTEKINYATHSQTRNKNVGVTLTDGTVQYVLAPLPYFYFPGYTLSPQPTSSYCVEYYCTPVVMQNKMTEYMTACQAQSETDPLLCNGTTVEEVESIVQSELDNSRLYYEMESVIRLNWDMLDLNVYYSYMDSVKYILWPTIEQHIDIRIVDGATGVEIPAGTTIMPGDPAADWDALFYFDATQMPNDYYHYTYDPTHAQVDLGPITDYGVINLTVLDANKTLGQTCIQNGVDQNLKSGNLDANTTIGEIKSWIQGNCMGASGFNFDPRLYDTSSGTNLLIFEMSLGSTFGTSLDDSTPITEIPFGSGPVTYSYKFSLNTTTAPTHYRFEDINGTFNISYTQKEMGVSQSEVTNILGKMQTAAQAVVDTKGNALNESNQADPASYVTYADLINAMDDYQNEFANDADPLIIGAMDVAYKFQYSNDEPTLTEVADPSSVYYHSGMQIQVSASFGSIPGDTRYVNTINQTYDPFVLTNDKINKIYFTPDIESTNREAYIDLETYIRSVAIDPFVDSMEGGTNSENVYSNIITYETIYNSIADQFDTTFGVYTQYFQSPINDIGTSLTVTVDDVVITTENKDELLGVGHHEITYDYVQNTYSICMPFTDDCATNAAFVDGIEMNLAPFEDAKLSLDIYQVIELDMSAKWIMDQRLVGYLEENFEFQEESGSVILVNENDLTYQQLLEGLHEVIDDYYEEVEESDGKIKPYIPREYICQEGCVIDYDVFATYREPEFNRPTSFSILGMTEAEQQQQIPSEITGFSYKILYDPTQPGNENIRFTAGGYIVVLTTWGELSADIAPPPLFGQALRVWIVILTFLVLIVVGTITGYLIMRKNKNKSTISRASANATKTQS